MKKLFSYSFAAFLLVFSSVTFAQPTPLKGGTCSGFTNGQTISSSLQFNCQHIGNVTISQIYEKGFRVVTTYFYGMGSAWAYLVIEEQRH